MGVKSPPRLTSNGVVDADDVARGSGFDALADRAARLASTRLPGHCESLAMQLDHARRDVPGKEGKQFGVPLTAAVALGVPLACFLVFERWFLVPLPKGPLEALLGL